MINELLQNTILTEPSYIANLNDVLELIDDNPKNRYAITLNILLTFFIANINRPSSALLSKPSSLKLPRVCKSYYPLSSLTSVSSRIQRTLIRQWRRKYSKDQAFQLNSTRKETLRQTWCLEVHSSFPRKNLTRRVLRDSLSIYSIAQRDGLSISLLVKTGRA